MDYSSFDGLKEALDFLKIKAICQKYDLRFDMNYWAGEGNYDMEFEDSCPVLFPRRLFYKESRLDYIASCLERDIKSKIDLQRAKEVWARYEEKE